MTELPPAVIAAADQDLAAVNAGIDQLVTNWRNLQSRFDEHEVDYLRRISWFIHHDVVSVFGVRGIFAALAVCASRLAAQHESP